MRSRIYWRRGGGCIYTRCPFCNQFISFQTDGSPAGDRRAKDNVGEMLADHCNANHLPGGEE